MKKLSLLFFILMLGMGAFARTYDGNEKIYIRPLAVSWWLNDNAKVGLYFFDDTPDPDVYKWAEATYLTLNGSDNIWSATVPAGTWTKVVITRNYASPVSWDNKWNQSDYIVIDATANYIYSFSESSTTATWQTLLANYKSSTTGNWSSTSTWFASFDNNNWFNAHYVPNNNNLSVAIMNGHNVTFNQNATVPSLSINSGGTFTSSDATARTLTISATTTGTTLANSGTWANGTGGSTVVFTGTSSSNDVVHTISGTNAFQNIIVKKISGSTKNVGASFGTNSSLTGTLEIGAGGYISTAPPTGFYGSGAILKFNQGTGATYDVGSSDNSWSSTVVPNYITISSGTVNLNANRTAIGDLLIDGGTLVLNNSVTLTIDKDWTRSSGSFTANTGTVKLGGSTNGKVDVTGGGTMYNLIISKTSGAQAIMDCNLTTSSLTIDANAILTVNAAKQLTVTGTATNNGTIKLLSTVDGTATVKGNVGGNAEVNQYLALPRRTWYMSSPVSGTVTPGGGVTNIKSYDETTGLWSSAGTTMIAKTGYLLYPSSTSTTEATTMTFNGTLNNGNIDIPLTRTSGKGNGFNLIGNPYPSHIVWTTDMATSAKLLTSIWYRTAVYNSSTSKNVYSFHTYNAAGTVASPVEATQYIPPMQAFWVRVDATSDGTETLTLTNSMRHHKSSNPLKAPAVKTTENQILRLQVAAGNITDEAVIYSNENASIGFDTYDSPKFMNDDTSIPEIYTTVGNEKLVINGMNSIPLNTEIGLGFVPGTATSFSIKANEVSNLPQDVTLILKDNATGTETDLTDGVTAYNFVPATTTGDRFSIILRRVSTTVETNTGTGIAVYSSQKSIHVTVNSALDENASVHVFNAVGQQLINQNLTSRSTSVNGNFKPGVYVVKVSNGIAASATQKIVIK